MYGMRRKLPGIEHYRAEKAQQASRPKTRKYPLFFGIFNCRMRAVHTYVNWETCKGAVYVQFNSDAHSLIDNNNPQAIWKTVHDSELISTCSSLLTSKRLCFPCMLFLHWLSFTCLLPTRSSKSQCLILFSRDGTTRLEDL